MTVAIALLKKHAAASPAEAKGMLDLELTAPSPRAGEHVRPQAKPDLGSLVYYCAPVHA